MGRACRQAAEEEAHGPRAMAAVPGEHSFFCRHPHPPQLRGAKLSASEEICIIGPLVLIVGCSNLVIPKIIQVNS